MLSKPVKNYLIPMALMLSCAPLNASEMLLDHSMSDLQKSAKQQIKSLNKKEAIVKAALAELKQLEKHFKKNPEDKENTYNLGRFYLKRIKMIDVEPSAFDDLLINMPQNNTPAHIDLGLRYMIQSGAKGQFEAAQYLEGRCKPTKDQIKRINGLIERGQIQVAFELERKFSTPSPAKTSLIKHLYEAAKKDKVYRHAASWNLAGFLKKNVDQKYFAHLESAETLEEQAQNLRGQYQRELKKIARPVGDLPQGDFDAYRQISAPLNDALIVYHREAHNPSAQKNLQYFNFNDLHVFPRLNAYENKYPFLNPDENGAVQTSIAHDFSNYGMIMSLGHSLMSFVENFFHFLEFKPDQPQQSRKNLQNMFNNIILQKQKVLVALNMIVRNINSAIGQNSDHEKLTVLEQEKAYLLQTVKPALINSVKYARKSMKYLDKFLEKVQQK